MDAKVSQKVYVDIFRGTIFDVHLLSYYLTSTSFPIEMKQIKTYLK